jgi:hypothetical protein
LVIVIDCFGTLKIFASKEIKASLAFPFSGGSLIFILSSSSSHPMTPSFPLFGTTLIKSVAHFSAFFPIFPLSSTIFLVKSTY